MKLKYIKPIFEATEMVPKKEMMLTISGHVENPDDSDSKKRYGFEEEENSSSTDNWGTIW